MSIIIRTFFFLFIFFIVYSVFDCYYGWLDDVSLVNLFKGEFTIKPFHSEEVFQLYSNILIFLYEIMPTVPWYGILLLILGFISFYNLSMFVFKSLGSENRKIQIPSFLLLILLYLFFFTENILLINYTRISILLVGSSLLGLWETIKLPTKKHNALFVIWYLFLFTTGYLIRNQTAFVPLFIVVFYSLTESIFNKLKVYKISIFFSLILFTLITHSIVFKMFSSDQYKMQRERWPYTFVLADGQRIFFHNNENSSLNSKDLIRIRSIILYYYHDYEMFDIEFLEKIGGKDVLHISFFNRVFEKLNREVSFIKIKKEGFKAGMSHYIRLIILICFNFLLIALAFFTLKRYQMSMNSFHQMSLILIIFILLIVLVTVFVKYEDRLFYPSFVIITFINLSILFKAFIDKPYLKKKLIWGLIIVILPLTIYRILSLYGVKLEKEKETAYKSKYIEELNTNYIDKVFIHDYWALTLLHNKPLDEMKLNNQNLHTVFGDLPYHELEFHRDYMANEVCPHNSFVEFYDCAKKDDRFIFVMLDLRVELLNQYFKILYDRDFVFEKVYNEEKSIVNINYSFLWLPLNIDFYKLN